MGELRTSSTRAIVVGIEQYAAGSSWDLDGPASDAVRFLEFLRASGIPKHNIYAYVAPLIRNEPLSQRVSDLAGNALRPTEENINRFFEDELRNTRAELLVLFWAGHGVITLEDERRLYTSDATSDNKRNVDLNSLLETLRSDAYRDLQRQAIIVDACANYIQGGASSLPQRKYRGGMGVAGREQFALYAGSPGEYAINLGSQKSGMFSRELMNIISTEKSIEGWPSRLTLVADGLAERFTKLRQEGKTQQTPATFWFSSPSKSGRFLGQLVPHELPHPPARSFVPKTSLTEKEQLNNALLDLESMRSKSRRNWIVRQLRPEISMRIERADSDFDDTLAILEKTIEYDALDELSQILRVVESGSATLDEFVRLVCSIQRKDSSEQPKSSVAVINPRLRNINDDERKLLRRLAVFNGGFSFRAAHALAPRQRTANEIKVPGAHEVSRWLNHLVDESLVIYNDDYPNTGRYFLAEGTVDYAMRDLEDSGDAETAKSDHVAYFRDLALQSEQELMSPHRQECLRRLDTERENILSAFRQCRETPALYAQGLELAGALFWFWNLRSYFQEGRQCVEPLLEKSFESHRGTKIWAKALYAAGGLAFLEGDIYNADVWLRESVETWRAQLQSGPEQKLDQERWLAYTLVILGRVQRDFLIGRKYEEESIRIFRRKDIGDNWGLALALNDLGYVLIADRKYIAGRRCYEKSLELWNKINDDWGLPLAKSNLACLDADQGSFDQALESLCDVLIRYSEAGYKWGIAETYKFLAELAWRQDQPEKAAEWYAESLKRHRDVRRKQLVVDCLKGLACVAVADREPRREQAQYATRLLGATDAATKVFDFPVTADDQKDSSSLRAKVERRLDIVDFSNRWAEGQKMSLEEAVCYALNKSPPAGAPSSPTEPDVTVELEDIRPRMESERYGPINNGELTRPQ